MYSYFLAVDGAVCSTVTTDTTQPDDLTAASPPTKSPKRNRCFTCRKKVGLTGLSKTKTIATYCIVGFL